MRNAATILNIIRERGRRGLPLEDVYRQLFNPELFLLAYGKIAKNAGALTPGVTTETVDGMSLAKIQSIIETLRFERYRFMPVRRVYIEKKNSTKKRPLGLPGWSDKLVQEAMRLILEAYYEPQFSPTSHGFRPNRGCHTALRQIEQTWKGTIWFIEGDIKGCFDNLDHQVLLSIVREKIRDNLFLRLLENCLRAGYFEEWHYHKTLSGAPQGGIVSPILSNIYLDRLDKFVEETLLPAFNCGDKRASNPEYKRLSHQVEAAKKTGHREDWWELRKQMQTLPTVLLQDPNYRRLRYIRYADDFLLGFTGPKSEAIEIKQRLREFLCDHLNLQLSETKTLITHGRTQAARFLGYDVLVLHDDRRRAIKHGKRTINGKVALSVPMEVVRERCQPYMKGGKPIHRRQWEENSVFSIITGFQQEYRGFAEYYQLAYNRSRRVSHLHWVVETSLTKTLAAKLRLSVPQVYDRFGVTLETPHGPRKGLQVKVARQRKSPLVATWGGISLKHDTTRTTVLNDAPKPIFCKRNDLLKRLLAETCELCGSHDTIEVHHIRRLSDLKQKGKAPVPQWVERMVSLRRKTLIVCHSCHQAITHGRPVDNCEKNHRRAG